MLNAFQMMLVVALFVFALMNLVRMVYEVMSWRVARGRGTRKNDRVETVDAGQEAQGMVVHSRESSGWDFGADMGGGCDGIGF